MAKSTKVIFAPNLGCAAEWVFYPSKKIAKEFPDAEVEFLGMDAQKGEVLLLKPQKRKLKKTTTILTLEEGHIELLNFSRDWQELKSIPKDAENIWSVEQMISAFASND